jgi:hypothetical protein
MAAIVVDAASLMHSIESTGAITSIGLRGEKWLADVHHFQGNRIVPMQAVTRTLAQLLDGNENGRGATISRNSAVTR